MARFVDKDGQIYEAETIGDVYELFVIVNEAKLKLSEMSPPLSPGTTMQNLIPGLENQKIMMTGGGNWTFCRSGSALAEEHETRIKYQDIVYKICNIADQYRNSDNPTRTTIDTIVARIESILKEKRLSGRTNLTYGGAITIPQSLLRTVLQKKEDDSDVILNGARDCNGNWAWVEDPPRV